MPSEIPPARTASVIGLLALLATTAGSANSTEPPACTASTRIVLRPASAVPSADRIVRVDDSWTIDACPGGPTLNFANRRRGVAVRAMWKDCGAAGTAVVRFMGLLARDCSSLRGRFHASGAQKPHAGRVKGAISRCGDHVLDPTAGEECDPTSCASPWVCTAACRCEDPTLSIDATFGTRGVVQTSNGRNVAATLDGRGRILFAVSEEGDRPALVVHRLSENGVVEAGFRVVIDGPDPYYPLTIIPLADGGFLTSAQSILRWNAAGQRVMPFGYGGELPDALALNVLPDGRLVTYNRTDGLRHYLSDGTPDQAYPPQSLPPELATDVTRAAFFGDGSLLVVQGHGPAIARRVQTDGSIDSSYAGTGMVSISGSMFPAAVDRPAPLPDGSLVVSGSIVTLHARSPWAKRVSTLGTFDWFGGVPRGMDAAGRLLGTRSVPLDFVGQRPYSGFPERLVLDRLLPDGAPDPGFGRSGSYRLPLYGSPAAYAVALLGQSDGKIVIVTTDRMLRIRP